MSATLKCENKNQNVRKLVKKINEINNSVYGYKSVCVSL